VIDGFKILVRLNDFEDWKIKTGIPFTIAMNQDTGEIKGRRQKYNRDITTYKYNGAFETYRLTVIRTSNGDALIADHYNMLIEGSFQTEA
jgi:hypothetical protein